MNNPQKDRKDYVIDALVQQRDQALNQLAHIAAEANEKIAEKDNMIARLVAELGETKAKANGVDPILAKIDKPE